MSAPPAPDREPAAPAQKRRRVLNRDGGEMSTGGLSKPTLNEALNEKCRILLIHLHMAFFTRFKFDPTTADDFDFDGLNHITSVIWTAYVKVKQTANNSGRAKDKIKDTDFITLNGEKVLTNHIVDVFVKICTLYDLDFTSRDATPAMRGCFQTNLSLLYSHKFRCQEGLYVNNTYRRADAEQEGDCHPVSLWGVNKTHWPMMFGGNFSPAMRSSLLQQMGPATILISLAEQTDERFIGKWRKAAIQQLAGVPNIETAVKYIEKKRFDAAALISEILDIAVFGTARQAHKGSIPFAMLWPILRGHAALMAFMAILKVTDATRMVEQEEEVTVFSMNMGIKMTPAQIPADVLKMDWSGKGFWNIYNKAVKHNYLIHAVKAEHKRVYQEWLTLSCTGLWNEDTAVLKFMFAHDFLNRRAYGDAFEKRRSSDVVISLKLLPAIHVTKLATAAQTNLGAQDEGVFVRIPAVSGKAFSQWKEDDPRRRLLLTEDRGDVGPITSLADVCSSLRKHKLRMEKRITTSGGISYGTTPWYKVTGDSSRLCYGELLADHVIQLDDKSIFTQTQ